jgi:16S rRNA (guanine(966)-N(2))-methyltransferase RsmD
MRIIGGTLRGRRLASPSGSETRPTAGQVKEALFNILAEKIPGARFLDLFAGAGAVGIEALSRGAGSATFVETHPAMCRLLRDNLHRCGFEGAAELRQVPASRFLHQQVADQAALPFDVVFLDPPYHTDEGRNILPALGRGVIIRRDGVVVIEHFHKTRLGDRIGQLALIKSYRYGDTLLSIYQLAPQEEP